MGIEFEFYEMKRVLEIGHTTVWMYLTLLNCTLKNGYIENYSLLYKGFFFLVLITFLCSEANYLNKCLIALKKLKT